ncbi:SGNH/GDSL hydrolase family protein [Mongoliibacter ruber]|uniref:Lysophospholipase L1-like esterase n=1 Tax=Mongoliibacter ruber TaxID=1750599 RepID=A0A2T0WMY6_9BACT|nr:SGNH/GDSL hydrolase family protein [Mongoliibacter ruber]PRY88061.1 lysophospholipase L1-like esterase [Mongoliibacter ruber]
MKKITLLSLFSFLLFVGCMSQKPTPTKNKKTLNYLALGDSYTIGEGVSEDERYPNQLIDLLNTQGLTFEKPRIIAVTGWTTDELAKGIEEAEISKNTYDLVTLLVGVNNQYRGRDVENYRTEFRAQLHQAIGFAKGDPNKVVVLSIPDWGITPFAEARKVDQEKVKTEIDRYNQAKKEITLTLGAHYIDITEDYREIGARPEMVVEDKLHPSGLVYTDWAKKIEQVIKSEMKFH